MTPLVLEIPTSQAETASGAVRNDEEEVHKATRSTAVFLSYSLVAQPEIEIGEPDLPEGIDYDRWAGNLSRSPREAFVDSLDDLDLDD